MRVWINERETEVEDDADIRKLSLKWKPDADVFILNGSPARGDEQLRPDDRITLIRRGEIPTLDELEALMIARHSPGIHSELKRAVVGIAGVGGLGSHVAVALARIGVGKLILADKDVVEPSNLNRQVFTIDHIGIPKVEAMQQILLSINPFVEVDPYHIRLDGKIVSEVFRECRILVEALDDAKGKAEIIEGALLGDPKILVVGGSGLAGYGPANDIRTERLGRLYICGDRVSEAGPGMGLMAPRVMITAGHQANQVLRLILGEDRGE